MKFRFNIDHSQFTRAVIRVFNPNDITWELPIAIPHMEHTVTNQHEIVD